RVPLDPAARRCPADLFVRQLALQRIDRPLGRHARGALFSIQWVIVLRELGRIAHSDTAKNIAKLIVPLIALAEICSRYAVITTNFLGNVLENSLWTVTFALVGIALVRLAASFRGAARWTLAAMAAGAAGYVVFMSMI